MRIGEEALLCGIMLGDGCLSVYKRKRGGSEFRIVVTLNSRDKKMAGVVFDLFRRLDPQRKPLIVDRKKWNAVEVRMHSKDALNRLSREWDFPIGSKNEISVPQKFVGDWNLMRRVVCGLFATDGTLIYAKQHKSVGYYPRIEFYSSSNTMLEQVFRALSLRGYKISRYMNRLSINGFGSLEKFRDEVGFLNDGQMEKLKIYTK